MNATASESSDERNASLQVLRVSDEGLPLADEEPSLRPHPETASMGKEHAVSAEDERLNPSELGGTSRTSLAARIIGEEQGAGSDPDSGAVE